MLCGPECCEVSSRKRCTAAACNWLCCNAVFDAELTRRFRASCRCCVVSSAHWSQGCSQGYARPHPAPCTGAYALSCHQVLLCVCFPTPHAGSSGASAEQPSSAQLPSSLYKESISFNSHITARTADAASSPIARDAQEHAGFPGLGAAGSAAAAAALDLSDPKVLLASAGLPADTQVVQPQYYMGGPQGPAARDATLNSK
jgi:hypothetical protein